MEAERPDGAIDVANVSVVAVVPYLIMKTAAMGRAGEKRRMLMIFTLLSNIILVE